MKKLIFLAFFISNIFAYSQIPQTISWQGILQDNQGTLLDGSYNFTVKIFDLETGGTPLWTETHQGVIVTNGFTQIALGSVNQLNLPFDTQYWLEITIGNDTPLSRMKLTASPYALNSKSISGVLEGVPLILKDNDGNVRIKLDPNNGTIEMLDDDTVWYSVEVNSPPKSRNVNGDGSYNINQNGKEATYNRNGTLLHDRDRTSYYDVNTQQTVTVEKTKYYYENGNVSKEVENKVINDHAGTIDQTTEKNFDPYGQLICEEVHERANSGAMGVDRYTQTKTNYNNRGQETNKVIRTYEKGVLNKEEFFENGVKINQKDYSQMKNDNAVFNPNGTVNRKITQYQDQLRSEIISGSQYSNVIQTQNSFSYQNSGTNTSFQITSAAGNAYKIGLGSQNPSNPSLTFAPGNDGGSTQFQGNGVFQNDLTANGNLYGSNANFSGDLNVNGTKNFRIEHPFEPESKYLIHAAIESNEVLNQYSGNIMTNDNGIAIVTLPDYFEAINTDFRYQLTVIGDFAQAIISKKIYNNQFEIKTDRPNIEVSWQITARRNDEYMRKNPFQDERLKSQDVK